MAEQDQTASEVAPSLCLKLSSRHSAWAVASPALGIATLAGTDNPRARGSRSLIGETSEADGGQHCFHQSSLSLCAVANFS